MRKLLLILSLFLAVSVASAQENTFMAGFFAKNKLNGTLVITSLDGKTKYVHNTSRADSAFLPASTFKIPNTLIALQEKAIADENEIIKWDGHKWDMTGWNQDQNLKTGMKYSCVWFYQELAKKVGDSTYLKSLKAMNYGNQLTGPELTTFWLNGDIRITANQQIEFLRGVCNQTLPFDARNFEILKKVMLTDSTNNYRMYAKTGWTARVNKQIGWYVGYLEVKGSVWLFAGNIDILNTDQLKFRPEMVYAGFRELGIIE